MLGMGSAVLVLLLLGRDSAAKDGLEVLPKEVGKLKQGLWRLSALIPCQLLRLIGPGKSALLCLSSRQLLPILNYHLFDRMEFQIRVVARMNCDHCGAAAKMNFRFVANCFLASLSLGLHTPWQSTIGHY
jgi:hypothetical protein